MRVIRRPATVAIFAAACTCLTVNAQAFECPAGGELRSEQDSDVGVVARWCERGGDRDGPYVLEHPDGTRLLSMHFRRGTPHGRLTRWHPDGTLALAGSYQMGQPHGTFVVWGRDGEVVGRYRMEHGTGIARTWWDNGKLREEVAFADGVKHGAYARFRRDGTRAVSGGFWRGLAHGLHEHFDAEGKRNGSYVLNRGTGTVVL